MKVQEAAFRLLTAEGRPLPAKQIARLALDRGWVQSSSVDPEFSIASTIEKNIRSVTYNQPELVFVRVSSGPRHIGLPKWKPRDLAPEPTRRLINVQIPEDVVDQIRLATQARLAPSFDATVALLLKRGLADAAADIRAAMARQLDALDRLGP